MPRFLACVAFVLLVGNATSQSRPALDRYRAAVLRGQEPLAESLLPAAAAGRDAAAQALLQAALLPPRERVQALLTLARGGNEEGRVVDLALVAAAAALAGADGCGEQLELEVPRLGREEDSGAFAALREILEQRQAQPDADRACLEETRRLIAVAGLVDVRPRAKVGTTMPLPVPAPLAEALEVRWLPWDGFSDPAASVAGELNRPADAVLAVNTVPLRVSAPAPGLHLLQVRETRTGRRMLRPVLASDLRVVAHRLPDALVVLGRHGEGVAAGAEFVLGRAGKDEVALTETLRADAQGLLQWTAPDARWRDAMQHGDMLLPARHQGHAETLRLAAPDRTGLQLEPITWHLMVERPLFRPGETVRGRLVLRAHELRITGTEAEVVSATYPVRRVQLVLWPRSKHEARFDLITDRLGVASFELPLPADAPLGWARVDLSGEVGGLSASAWPFTVQEFRRAPVQMDVVVTDPVDGLAEVRVAVRFASGAPAAGLPLTVVAAVGGLEHRVRACLDAAGIARIPVRLDGRDLPWGRSVEVVVRATAPDGQELREERSIALRMAAPELRRERTPCVVLRTAMPRAGEPVTVVVKGPPGHWALLTARRQSLRHAERALLDAQGEASVTFATWPSDWPALEVMATGLPASSDVEASWNASLRVPLQATQGLRQVTVAGHERRFRPRETAELHVHTTDGAGQGVPAVVTVAVVDEAVFQQVEDTTEEPHTALVPDLRIPDATVAVSEAPLAPLRVIGELLEDGRLGQRQRFRGAGGPTTPGPGGPTEPARSDFHPTAFFLPACETDADGRATVRFAFPDDLTRWRITVVAVDAHAGGARTVGHAETRLPLSVTPLLPRFLRTGDRITVPLLVQREAEVQGPATVAWGADGKHLAGEAPRQQVLAADQRQARSELVAGAPGSAELTAEVSTEAHRDAVRHALPVLADVARTRVVTPAYADRATTLPLPATQGKAPARASVVLFGGREALLARAAEFLQGYPHGCVEQTCSRLVPLFAASRALRLKTGRDGVVLGAEQKAALRAGMKRLQELLVRGDEGFAWWPAHAVDQGMTALVFTALAQGREAGIDPAAWGLMITPGSGALAALAGRLVRAQGQLGAKDDESGVEQAELVVACLRLRPSAPAHLDAVQQLVRREQALPRGLLARAGLALARAGETALAEQALERVLASRAVSPVPEPGVRFPGESEAAVTACLLELALAVKPEHTARAQLATRLLSLGTEGVFDSTWATAAAMNALLLDAELSGKAPDRTAFAVVVEQDGKPQRVELTPAGSFRAEIGLPGKGPVTVTPDAGRAVHFALRTELDETGSAAAALAQPIQLTRALIRAERISGAMELVPLDQPIPAGERLHLRIRATAAQELRYVCVTCPLPAGFEVAGKPSGVEVRDHQVVVGCPRMQDGVFETMIPVVAARSGAFSWPPAEAEAMYDPELRGRTAGCRLRVEVGAAESRPARTAELLGPEFFAGRRAGLVATLTRAADWREVAAVVHGPLGERDRAALAPVLEACAMKFVDLSHALAAIAPLAVVPWAEAWGRVREGRASLLDLLVVIHGVEGEQTLASARELTQRLLDGTATTALSAARQRRLLWREIEPILWSPVCAAVRAASEAHGVAASDGAEMPSELVAMGPLLQRVRDAMGPQEAAFDPLLASALRACAVVPVVPGSGALPSASQRWIEQQSADFEWELVDRYRRWDPRQVVAHCDPTELRAVAERLVDRLYHGNAARMLSRWLVAALGDPHEERAGALLAILADHPDVARDCESALCRALEDPREAVRRAAFAIAPDGLRRRYQHLLALRDDAWLGTDLWQDPAPEQQDWLRRRLVVDPTQVRQARMGLADVRAALGRERFDSLPLRVLAEWQDEAELSGVLADSSHRDDELLAELARAETTEWRLALARACLRRGVRAAALPVDDPLAECLAWALRCRTGDAAAADRVRVWLLEADPCHESVRPLLAEALVPQLRLRELPRYAELLEEADVARIRDRAGLAEWRELFRRAPDAESLCLDAVPWQLAGELRHAALDVAARAPELRERIVDWILETEGGFQFLRARPRRESDPLLEVRIADQVRQRIGAPEGAPEQGQFLELLRLGALEPRTAAEQLTLRQLLRRRALLLPGE